MRELEGSCPLTLVRLVDEYFAESRNHLLELAAFLDRVDRACDGADPASEFRMHALLQAAQVLLEPGPARVKRMALALSDPTDEPRGMLDRKGAWGAYTASPDGER